MNRITKSPLKQIGYNFIPESFLPENGDEYYLRNTQIKNWQNFRHLTAHEIEVLVKNENSADNWNDIFVSEEFNPDLVKNSQFHGLVRIGNLENYYLEFHDIRLPVGIYNSNIISCDIGSNVSVSNVSLLSHYIIGNEVILQNVDELVTTSYAKFGNGIIKEGEDESVRIWIEVGNENGGRRILPFNGMLAGDAWLWSRFRDRTVLIDRLKEITQNSYDRRRGHYGEIQTRSVIKHCRILKDVNIGSDAYIKGSNKLKNLTINSNADSPTQIGEGVELVNGIIGFGCRVFYGVKAVRFIMDDYTNLKYGARLVNSFLGSNSTISCCEVLNALIFPGHEQHHNSSFLCASTIYGQSNMASGATIGSNHNSRGNDGEITAGRGFWPGLSTSLKHNSLFASFSLLVKGAYPAEINNPLPFSLLANNESENCLLIIPAYWFSYNMYAIARNSWKYKDRDKRKVKKQLLEFDFLAPDTVNEILGAMQLLRDLASETEEFRESGRDSMHEYLMEEAVPCLRADHLEKGSREVRILKASQAYRCYYEMIILYSVRAVIQAVLEDETTLETLTVRMEKIGRPGDWFNAGGQLIRKERIEELITLIESSGMNSWEEIHSFYSSEAESYEQDRLEHALASLAQLMILSKRETDWDRIIREGISVQKQIARRTRESRAKDYSNEFRNMTYSTEEERDAVVGKLEDNSFILHIEEETGLFEQKALSIIER